MKKRLFWPMVLFFFWGCWVGFGMTRALAQPSIVGDWLFDISGKEKGVVIVHFYGNSFEGYGFGMGGEIWTDGSYTINAKGVISGTFGSPEPGTFSGKVDKKVAKISIKAAGGPNMKGIRLPADPIIPAEWTVKVKGGGAKGTFDPFSIEPDGFYHRLYYFEGCGFFQDVGKICVEGGFFLNSKNVAFGGYVTTVGIYEEGVLTGKVNLSSRKFSIKTTSTDGLKHTLSGVAK